MPDILLGMALLIQQKGLDRAERIQLGLSYLLQGIILGTVAWSLFQHSWLNAATTAGILFLTFLPKIIRHNYKVHLPVELDFIAILFIFAALFLGEVHAYYTRYVWWDVVLHTSSGFLLGLIGFLLIYILNEEPRVHVELRPGFVAWFGFAFAVAIGALWEIFEFFMDQNFGFHMQQSGLVDTMWDMIVDSAGAGVIALLGYFFIRRRHFLLFERVIHRFVQRNPRFFRRRFRRYAKRYARRYAN